ncbi:MAG: 50S ribosomal protein L10 [Candidatus Pacebacteria bacterium]|nr:50S ribosomal protein L10 [Candidatus Paceibacterota bacterium]
MVASKKIFTVENLREKIKGAAAFYLVNYQGLNVAQLTRLRQEVRETGGELEVVKNRLAKRALAETDTKNDQLEAFSGPTAILWANQDEVAPLKTLVSFASETGLPEIKIGFLGKELLDQAKTKELSQIPSGLELKARLVGSLAGPLYGLTNGLGYNLRKLIFILKNIAEKTDH